MLTNLFSKIRRKPIETQKKTPDSPHWSPDHPTVQPIMVYQAHDSEGNVVGESLTHEGLVAPPGGFIGVKKEITGVF